MYWTNHAEDRILRAFLGVDAIAPATVFAGLFLSDPGDAGQGTEITYAGYVRQPITFSEPAAETSGGVTSMRIANLQNVAFPVSATAAGTVTHFGLMDSLTGGNMWAYMTLDEPMQVDADVAPLIMPQEWTYVFGGDYTLGFMAAALNLLRGVNLVGFTPFVALLTGDPDAGGAELAGSGYARFPVTFASPVVQVSGQSMIQNTAGLSSPRALDNWGTWAWTAVMSAENGGVAVAGGPRPPYIMGRDKAALIRQGELSLSLT